MPSYIELDKQGSFPPASNDGKVIFGVDTSGNVTITNVSGTTTPIGGGAGLHIPEPIIYAESSVGANSNHSYNVPISSLGDGNGIPGSIQGSWNQDGLRITYDTYDETFLNYNPKYFLFVYKKSKKQSKANTTQPNNRLNGKYGKYFAHPPSFSGGTNISTYKNFSGSELLNGTYEPSFADFTTEWDVTSGKGKETTLNGFNPLRFYYPIINGTTPFIGQEFFPIKINDLISGNSGSVNVSTTTLKGYKKFLTKRTTPVETYLKPRVDLYLKFAIVINDPNNPGRYLIGPMSDTIKIFPKSGYFEDDINDIQTYKYFYTWAWKFV